MTPTLTILRGISGCGKSTWAEAQAGHPAIVSRDRIRMSLFGTEAFIDEDLVTRVAHGAIEFALKAGRDVIVDDTNIRVKYIKPIANIGYRLGANVELKFFEVDLQTALFRNGLRANMGGRNVPASVIKKQYDGLKGTRDFFPEPPYLPAPYTGTPGMPKAVLVDVDGTLAHMRDLRGPFEWKRVGVDEPDLNVMQVVNWIRGGMHAEYLYPYQEHGKIILMSGRDESCRQETFDWATSWDFNFDYMFMRPEGDMRPDNIVKAELFDTHIRDKFDVVGVIDDRRQVVDMWLSMGLKVFNVAGMDRGEF